MKHSAMDLQAVIFQFIYGLIKKYYLYAPRWLGGNENLPLIDICVNELKISSSVLLTDAGHEICQEKIDNVLTGYTTIFITALIVYCITCIPSLLGKGYAVWDIHYTKSKKAAATAAAAVKRKDTIVTQKSYVRCITSIATTLKSNRIDANMKLLDIGQTIEETLTETGKTEVGLLGYVFEDYSFHKSTLSIRN